MVIARSQDMAFGWCLDIFRYATLQTLLARRAGLEPRFYSMPSANNHIYSVNEKDIRMMIHLEPTGSTPNLIIHNVYKPFNEFVSDDFELVGYDSHPALKLKFAG